MPYTHPYIPYVPSTQYRHHIMKNNIHIPTRLDYHPNQIRIRTFIFYVSNMSRHIYVKSHKSYSKDMINTRKYQRYTRFRIILKTSALSSIHDFRYFYISKICSYLTPYQFLQRTYLLYVWQIICIQYDGNGEESHPQAK